jgi:hypothetical protein
MRPGSKHSTLLAVADDWVSSLAGVANGEMDVPSNAGLALTGHSPMAFDEFLRRNPENYRHLLLA